MVLGSSLNLINTYADKSAVQTNEELLVKLPIVEPEVLTIDDSRANYKIKEESPAVLETKDTENIKKETGLTKEKEMTQTDKQRFLNEGISTSELKEIEQLAAELKEEPEIIIKKMKALNKDLEKVREAVLQEKMYTLPEAMEEKYAEELKKIDLLGVTNKERMQLVSILELQPNSTIDKLLTSFTKNGSEWLESQLEQAYKSQTFDSEKLAQYGLTNEEVTGISPATLNQLEKVAEKTKRPFKELVAEIRSIQTKN